MPAGRRAAGFRCELLEARNAPAAGPLTVSGSPGDDRLRVFRDGADLVVLNGPPEIARVAAASVTGITIRGEGGNDSLVVEDAATQPVNLDGGPGDDKLGGGGGPAVLTGGGGD